jgi:hypothetical protein
MRGSLFLGYLYLEGKAVPLEEALLGIILFMRVSSFGRP